MKKKDLKNLREKSLVELNKEATELRLNIGKDKVKKAVKKEKDVKAIRRMSHDLSQILTIMREKEIMEVEKGGKKQ